DRPRRPRAAPVVRQTRRLGAVLQARGRLALRARDAALGAISPRLLSGAAASAAQWRPPS
ncbi:FAD-dependent monooxygenase, partial [Micromonospora sp. DH15]|nr:FAD-dependent monooxygenase [Micromonospora sp. DH15]